MAQRPYDLPSLAALACFEAAARHESFKQASSELNVTPAAVSHQIKALERDLGRPLFNRHYRGVELTETGAFLFVVLQRGFEAISDTIGQIRQRADRVDVTIHATTAVSALWLTPKLAAFWKSHADISVAQVVQDVDQATGSFDLSIRYGDVTQDSGDTRVLFRDRIMALGTAGFAAKYVVGNVTDLLQSPLIHLSSDEARWTGWSEWFATLGQPAPRGHGFTVNNYMIALQAAQDDMGAVLGWEGLVGQIVEDGRLIQLVPDTIPSPMPFYLKVHPKASDNARLFADWLSISP